HSEEGLLLGDENFRIGGIGQKEPFEGVAEAAGPDFFDHRLKRGKDAHGCLVVNRHHDRRALMQRIRWRGWLRRNQEKPDKTSNGTREGERNPRKIGNKEKQKCPFEKRYAADLNNLIHLVGAVAGQGQTAAEHEKPRQPTAKNPVAVEILVALGAVEPCKALRRHRERRFGWHTGGGVQRERAVAGTQPCHHRIGWPWIAQSVHR